MKFYMTHSVLYNIFKLKNRRVVNIINQNKCNVYILLLMLSIVEMVLSNFMVIQLFKLSLLCQLVYLPCNWKNNSYAMLSDHLRHMRKYVIEYNYCHLQRDGSKFAFQIWAKVVW